MLHRRRYGTALATILGALAMAPHAAHADAQTVKLIQLLIQKGILTPGQAKDLLKESGAPAASGRKHAPAIAPLDSEEVAPPTPAGQIRVTYVPQFVRKQIADEVRAQVLDQAQEEGWAAPNALPEWTKRIKLFGDLRVRFEDDLYDKNNYNQFVNFNSINNGSPYDANAYANGTGTPPPFLNTNENRDRFRLRARFGLEADIADWVSGTIMVGTGQDDAPVSTNQTFGLANGTAAIGDFALPSIWLDRAYVKMHPFSQLYLYAGRMESPFIESDLMFYEPIGFDGFAAQFSQPVGGGVTLLANAGGFPLFNPAFDFSTNSDQKFATSQSYLAGVQGGALWQITSQLNASLGVGLFDFINVQGAVSNTCTQESGTTSTFFCNTDDTRAPYGQFGNTLYPIRNIPYTVTSIGQIPPDPQYYGLASRFDVLDIHPRVNILTYDPIDIALEGQFIKNLAYNRAAIVTHGPPNETPGPVNSNNGVYEGGDTGYMVKATLGQFIVQKKWDWNISLSYRYLQSDATLDAFTDPDFHQGGTNAQGYILGGNLGIARNTWVNLRWYSAQAISGPHYGTDTLFFDLNARF